MYMIWVWLAICVASVVVELVTPQVVSIWFAAGAFVCMWLAFIPGLPWWAQIIIFAVLSVVALFALRPVCRRYLDRRKTATNVDSLIGKQVRMLSEANFDVLGSAKIGDVVWSVKGKDDAVLPQGAIVTVEAVEGNKLVAALVSEGETIDNNE